MPGHGHSQALANSEPVLGDFTSKLEGFIAEAIGQPILLAGHSMGAMIALDFARRNPDQCCGLVALNAVHRRSPTKAQAVKQRAAALGKGQHDAGMAVAPVRRWFGETPEGFECDLAQQCRNWLTRVDRGSYAAAYSIFANNGGLTDVEFAALTMPILFLTGEDDENSTAEMSHVMAQLAPAGEAVAISGARHLAQLTHAEQVNFLMHEFFARCKCGASGTRLDNREGR